MPELMLIYSHHDQSSEIKGRRSIIEEIGRFTTNTIYTNSTEQNHYQSYINNKLIIPPIIINNNSVTYDISY